MKIRTVQLSPSCPYTFCAFVDGQRGNLLNCAGSALQSVAEAHELNYANLAVFPGEKVHHGPERIRPLRLRHRASRRQPPDFSRAGKIWRLPARCAMTKPKRANPLRAMMYFFPREDRQVRVIKFMSFSHALESRTSAI